MIPLEELSPDVLYWIFYYLDACSFVSLASTCMTLHDFSQRKEVDSVWKEIYRRQWHSHTCETFPHFSQPSNNQRIQTKTWKSMYQSNLHQKITITNLNTLLSNTRPLHSTSFRAFQIPLPDAYSRNNFQPPRASRPFSHFLFRELSTLLAHPFPASDLYMCTKFELEKWMNISFKMRTREIEFCKKVYENFVDCSKGREGGGKERGGDGGLCPPLFLTTCNSAGSCSFCPAFVAVSDCLVSFCVIIDRD